MKKISKVALNMSNMPVPQKINKSRVIADAILSNPGIFVAPIPAIITIQFAIDELEFAWNEAADGGKMLTAAMHDKETTLMKLLNQLVAYVEALADGDEEIIHLSGMSLKKDPTRSIADFSVEHGADRGSVFLRVKPEPGKAYRWEYCIDPIGVNPWTVAKTTVQSTTTVGHLAEGARYWFRVAFTDSQGETYPYNDALIIVI